MFVERYSEALLEYLSRGWTIIPLAKDSKRPAVEWKKYQTQKPSDEELASWFGPGSEYGMGLVTGSASGGLFVVDLDAYKGDVDVETFLETYPTDLIAKTPNGGIHLFYTSDAPMKTTQNVISANVDTRGEGGYVVVAPTVIDGRGYTWFKGGDPAPVPLQIAALLDRTAPEGSGESSKGPGVSIVSDYKSDGLDLLSQIVSRGFTPGQHNAEVQKLTRLAYRALSSESDEFKMQFLWRLVSALDARDPTPQAVEGKLIPTIQSAINYEKERLQKVAKVVGQDEPLLELKTMEQALIDWDNYETRWLIDDILVESSIIMMSAPPESWKTWMLLDMALSVALGKGQPFLNHFNVTPHAKYRERMPVILFQQEDHPGEVVKRLSMIMSAKTRDVGFTIFYDRSTDTTIIESPHKAPLYIHERAQLNFEDPRSIAMMRQRIEEVGARLVLVDPLYSLASADNYFQQLALTMKTVKQIRTDTGCGFVFAHHSKKSATSTSGRAGAFGSVLLDGAMEGAIVVSKQSPKRVTVSRSGKVYPDMKSFDVEFDVSDGYVTEGDRKVFRPEAIKYNTRVSYGTTSDGDASILSCISVNPGITAAGLSEELDVHVSTVYRNLKRLVEVGAIKKVGNGYEET